MKTTEQLTQESGIHIDEYGDIYIHGKGNGEDVSRTDVVSAFEAFRRECEREVLEEFATKWLPCVKRCDNQTSQSQAWQNQGVNDAIRLAFAMIKERTK
ncbi:hypothetical protein UFOVP138_35 [uncultured Caudovirales phage]|uniref:Uncharacterized protein n=1 Tax=uncultured Caudovirales phage TaxID=2100421 RepID=A0A6J5LC28_9CAUD|nr:hypothetical protein UFOVP138_35 [uncultured Caudovirales phage]